VPAFLREILGRDFSCSGVAPMRDSKRGESLFGG
jgi:hypothetical protein